METKLISNHTKRPHKTKLQRARTKRLPAASQSLGFDILKTTKCKTFSLVPKDIIDALYQWNMNFNPCFNENDTIPNGMDITSYLFTHLKSQVDFSISELSIILKDDTPCLVIENHQTEYSFYSLDTCWLFRLAKVNKLLFYAFCDLLDTHNSNGLDEMIFYNYDDFDIENFIEDFGYMEYDEETKQTYIYEFTQMREKHAELHRIGKKHFNIEELEAYKPRKKVYKELKQLYYEFKAVFANLNTLIDNPSDEEEIRPIYWYNAITFLYSPNSFNLSYGFMLQSIDMLCSDYHEQASYPDYLNLKTNQIVSQKPIITAFENCFNKWTELLQNF